MASSSPLYSRVKFSSVIWWQTWTARHTLPFSLTMKSAFPLVFIVADAARLPAQMQEDKVLQAYAR